MDLREAVGKIEALISERTIPEDEYNCYDSDDAVHMAFVNGLQEAVNILRTVTGALVDVRIDKTQPLSCGNCHLQDSSLACVVLGYDRTWGLEDGEKLPRCPAVILKEGREDGR